MKRKLGVHVKYVDLMKPSGWNSMLPSLYLFVIIPLFTVLYYIIMRLKLPAKNSIGSACALAIMTVVASYMLSYTFSFLNLSGFGFMLLCLLLAALAAIYRCGTNWRTGCCTCTARRMSGFEYSCGTI